MQFGIIGISYRQAPIEVRDRAAFSDSKKIEFYDRLREQGICQAVILSTCNRSEVSFLMADEKESAVVKEEFLLQCGSPELKEYLFEKKGEEALHYLFCVAAGLDSLVVGEDQILGQVQSALDFSRRVGGCGKQMNRIFLDAITCAKKIKTQLKISEHPISICYIGMKCLAKACKIEGKTALVIGSGKMAALALTYSVTNPIIQEANAAAAEAARQEVLPGSAGFEEVTGDFGEGVVSVYRATDGKGYVVTAETNGYGGNYQTVVGIDSEGKIVNLTVMEQNETPGLGTKTAERDHLDQYIGKDSSLEGVTAISGSTISSNALKTTVEMAFSAVEAAENGAAGGETPAGASDAAGEETPGESDQTAE